MDCPSTTHEVCQITQVRQKHVMKVQYPYGIVFLNFYFVQYLSCHSQWWGIPGATAEANMKLKFRVYLRWESNWLSTGFWSIGTLLPVSFSSQMDITKKFMRFQVTPMVIQIITMMSLDDYRRRKVTESFYAKLIYVLVRCEFINKPEKTFRSSEIPVRKVGVQAMTVDAIGSWRVGSVGWIYRNQFVDQLVEQEWRPTKLRWQLMVVIFRSYIITSLLGENLADHQGLSKTVATSDLIQHQRCLLTEEPTTNAKDADRAYKEKS